MVKILICGDFHCGDIAGLTPPEEQKASGPYADMQSKLWNWWEESLAALGPFDMTLFTGDMTEGEGKKDTINLYETDTERQAEIAASCASVIQCPRESMFCVYGTPFHTAGTYSYENHFAETLGIAKPKTMQLINVNNMARINVKHTVGRSSIPYGSGTPTYKEMINEIVKAANMEDESADIVVRGHAHMSVSMMVGSRLAIVAPCMKYPESIFGRKLQDGDYHMGYGILEIYGKKDFVYKPVLLPLSISNKRKWELWNSESQLL